MPRPSDPSVEGIVKYKTKLFSDWLGNHVEVSYDKESDVGGEGKELAAAIVQLDTEDDELLCVITGDDCVELILGPIRIQMTFGQFHVAATRGDGPKILATVEQRRAI